jgi:hypothetical protein
MSQMYQQSKAIRDMVVSYRKEHVQDDSNVQAMLERIEENFVSDQVKTSEILALLQFQRRLLVGIFWR